MAYHTTEYKFSDKGERSTDIFYNTEEPQKHYAKWKTWGHILCDSIYMKYPDEANLETESKFVVA